MITQITTETYADWYRQACAGKLYFDGYLPLQLELFGRCGGNYFAGEQLAMDANGDEVIACGTADPEELASFLAFLDKHRYLTDGTAPAGWHAAETLHRFCLPAGQLLPEPPAPDDLTRNEQPSAMGLARFLFGDDPLRDDFYAELCTKRNHGKARVWSLEAEGRILATAGAYGLHNGQAYLACVKTDPACRGRGLAGWLVRDTANHLAKQGWQVVLLARPDRFSFYEGLGFVCQQELTIYTDLEK